MSRGSPTRSATTTVVAVSGNRAVQWAHGTPREAARRSRRPDEVGAISAALDQVGPRLRRVRDQRGLTLTEVAERTGISKSTLSRLETGQRRPSLELLLPLAQVVPGAARRPGRRSRDRRPTDPAQAAARQRPDRAAADAARVASRRGRSSSRRPSRDRTRARMTASSGSTSCPGGCGWCSATRTSSSVSERRRSSTRRCRTGSAAPASTPPRCSASSVGAGERMHLHAEHAMMGPAH